MNKKKQRRPLQEFQRKSETARKLENLIPEDKTIKTKSRPIEKAVITTQIKEKKGKFEKEIFEIEAKKGKPEYTTTKVKPNLNLIKVMNLTHWGRIYFDKEECDYFLYVLGKNRPKARYLLDETNIDNLLAFCLYRIYGSYLLEQKNPRVYVGKKLIGKIRTLLSLQKAERVDNYLAHK